MKTLTVKIFILAFILAISGMSQAQVAKPKVAYVNNVDKVMAATAASVDNDPIIQMLKADTLIDVDVLLVKKDSVFDLSGYDVVIAQEGFGSSDPIYKPGGTLGMGSIPVPFILNKVFTMKAGRGFAAGALGSGGEVAGTFNININNTYKSHDLFKGMTNSKGLSQIFFSGAADNGDASLNKGLQYATGVVISSKNTLLASGQNDPVEATVCVNDIPAGDTIGSEVLKARMIAFGMNYGAICKDGNNLTPDGLTLWRNAVYSLAGITVPTTKVDNSNDIKSITSSVGMVKINGNAGLAELVLPAGAASATLTITPVTEGAVVTPATIEASAGNTYQVSVVAPIAGAPKVYTISVSSQKEGEILYVSSDSYGIYSEAKAYDKNVYDALVEAGYSVTMVKKDALNAEGFDYTPYAGIVLSGGAGSSNVNGYAKMGYPIPCVSLQNDGAKNDKWGWVNYKNAAQYAATKVYDVNTAQIKITNNTHPITEAYAVDEMVTWTLGTPDSADWAGKEIKSYNLTDSIPEAVALATIPADGKLFPVMWAIPAGTSVRSLQADNSYARIPTTSNIVLMYIYNDGLLYAAPGFDQLLAKSLNWAINGDQGTSNKKEIVFVKRLENNYDSIVIANIAARPEFNVTVVAQNVLTPDLLPQLNAADVVIMGRSIPSSDAGSGNAVWDAITAPVMSMNMYAMRGMAAKCYWTPNVTCENISNAAGVYLQANILAPNDPVFEGMPATIDWWEGVGNIFSVDAEGDDAGNGVLLAETADKRPLLIRWPAGVEYYPGSGHVPQSPRSYMGNGSDGGGAINYFNFSEDAKKIFFNELARMASLPKPEKPNVDPLTIFDPATVDASALPDGMTIVEIDGTSYLQVVLNGWNSNLKIPEYTILKEGMAAVCNMKYTLGPNATAYDATKVNAVVQLMDTINLVPASWNPSQMIPAALGLMKSGPDGKMYFASGTFAKEMKIIHNVQFFGQETVSWGPTTGDTIWVGKIRAQYLEENVIFDPVNVDTSDVNVSIVDIGGAKYARVVLQGWNSVLPVPKFTLKEGMSAKTNIQYEIAAGKSYTAAQVNAVAQLMDVINLIPNPWNPTGDPVPSAISLAQNGVDGKLTEVSGKFVSEMKFVNQVQLFGQETVTWGPTIGDVMYCGKIVASLPAVAKVTFKVDDSAGKTHKDFVLRGSWKQATGVYDKDWDGGKDQTQMYDDGTHGDAKAGDNIWTVTLDLVSDGGTNTWEWGFLAETVWIPTANIQFKVADGKAQTSTFVIKKSGVETFGSNIKLYPNPTSGVLNISGVDVSTVEVYNLSGARMLIDRFTSNQVDVSSLSRGAYILKITSNQNQTVMRKFNKN